MKDKTTRIIVIGLIQTPPYDRMFVNSRRVYSAKGISPALHTQGVGIERLRCWLSFEYVRTKSLPISIFALS